MSENLFAIVTETIRPATQEELSRMSSQPNPRVMAEIAKAEIADALQRDLATASLDAGRGR